MSRIKLVKCVCGGEAEAICDGLWCIHCVVCGEQSRSWVFLREASKEWNDKNREDNSNDNK